MINPYAGPVFLPDSDDERPSNDRDASITSLYQPMRMGQTVAKLAREVSEPLGAGEGAAEALWGAKTALYFISRQPRVLGRVRELVALNEIDSSSGAGLGSIYVDDPQWLADDWLGAESSELEDKPDVEALFNDLAETWVSKTRFESSFVAMFMHDAYLQIVGLGREALPFLVARLRSEPERWLWALRSVARHDPVPENATREQTISAWEQWLESAH